MSSRSSHSFQLITFHRLPVYYYNFNTTPPKFSDSLSFLSFSTGKLQRFFPFNIINIHRKLTKANRTTQIRQYQSTTSNFNSINREKSSYKESATMDSHIEAVSSSPQHNKRISRKSSHIEVKPEGDEPLKAEGEFTKAPSANFTKSTSNLSTSPTKISKKKRSNIIRDDDEEEDFMPSDGEDIEGDLSEDSEFDDSFSAPKHTVTKKLTKRSSSSRILNTSKTFKEPEHWNEVLNLITEKRKSTRAAVDEYGAHALGRWNLVKEGKMEARQARFYTLVALMLSSQTKDPVTADAIRKLESGLDGNQLSVESMLSSSEDVIDRCIGKVGFHNRKAIYLKKAAQICREKYGGDTPRTYEQLIELPGVGPKMAYLFLQIAYGEVSGIGVDVHVHRISNRLGWAESSNPEQTRYQLQSWLPQEYWDTINVILVGFGQTVCLPINPKCSECPVAKLCPSSSLSSSSKPIRKKSKLYPKKNYEEEDYDD